MKSEALQLKIPTPRNKIPKTYTNAQKQANNTMGDTLGKQKATDPPGKAQKIKPKNTQPRQTKQKPLPKVPRKKVNLKQFPKLNMFCDSVRII